MGMVLALTRERPRAEQFGRHDAKRHRAMLPARA
jgi:hypothetical protein